MTDREQERAAVVAVICLLLAGCQAQTCVDGKHYIEQGQQGVYVATGNDCVAIERGDHLTDRPAP